jgi:phosphatidylserine decarboxylase
LAVVLEVKPMPPMMRRTTAIVARPLRYNVRRPNLVSTIQKEIAVSGVADDNRNVLTAP